MHRNYCNYSKQLIYFNYYPSYLPSLYLVDIKSLALFLINIQAFTLDIRFSTSTLLFNVPLVSKNLKPAQLQFNHNMFKV